MNDHAALVSQFENSPAEGLRRFWISWISWLEDWPEGAPFFFWETGTLCDGRLRPSMKNDPRAANLPERANMLSDALIAQITFQDTDSEPGDDSSDVDSDEDEEDDMFDTFYISGGTVCAWIDAVDEDAAWKLVAEYFPDFEKRFCEERPLGSLSGAAKGGRFPHPDGSPKTRAVFMLNHGFVVCAFPDHYGSLSGVVRTFEGGGRFFDRPRDDFRQMSIAQPGRYRDTIQFLKDEFQMEVLAVDSVMELITREDQDQ